MVPMALRKRPGNIKMTLKEKLAKAKLVNKYTVELENYKNAIKQDGPFTEFNIKKAAEFQAKLDAIIELEGAA